MILTALSNAPGAQLLTLANDGASDTGYTLLEGADFGTPTYAHTFSGARGTQGARPAQGALPNRSVKLPIRVAGTTKDQMAQRTSVLVATFDDLRRYGGEVRMRSKSQTYAQSFDVLTAQVSEGGQWSNRIEHRYLQLIGLDLICGPYMLGDWLDLNERFAADSINGSDPFYTARAGALASITVANGLATQTADLTNEQRLTWTRSGYTFGDHEVSVEGAPGATITNWAIDAILSEISATTYLDVYLHDNGTNTRLRIDKVVAGVRTNLATTNLAIRQGVNRRATVRGRLEGNVVFAEHFMDTASSDPTSTPTTSLTYVLTTAEAATFGEPAEGRAGWSITAAGAGAYVSKVDVLPFTYRNPPLDAIDCFGAIPGDAPALGRVRMAPQTVGGVWGLFGWAPRARQRNMVEHGDFDVLATPALRWSQAAVTGVLANAGTSATVQTAATVGYGARTGGSMLQIVTPATANSGATYTMRQRFKRGSTYRLTLWVRSNAGTTLARARLGVNGDVASSTAVALSGAWTQHVVDWTPTADVTTAYVAVEVTAATATTFQVDQVVVTRGTAAPTWQSHPNGGGASPPLGVLYAEESAGAAAVGLTLNAVTNAIDGSAMSVASVPAGGGAYSVDAFVDAGLIAGEDYALQGSVSVEFWARVLYSSAHAAISAVVSASAPNASGQPLYSSEFGSTGTVLESVATGGNNLWRVVRLGTIDLPAYTSDSRYIVTAAFTVAAGTNAQQFAVDHLIAVPSRARFASPTAKRWSPTDLYPFFSNAGAGSGGYRQVNPDLTSFMANAGGNAAAAGGITGAVCELPRGLISILPLVSNRPPDDPGAYLPSFSELQAAPATHVGVRPRWHFLRT